MQFADFFRLPIIDSHVHFVHPERMEDILQIIDTVPCQRINLVSIPDPDPLIVNHNRAALLMKERFPERTYISGALDYSGILENRSRACDEFANQITKLKSQGFDGLKLIEGKPLARKYIPFGLDAPEYEGMWSALEELSFPVVMHVADPDEFWDEQRCPGWARKAGWFYPQPEYPSKEQFYSEVDHVLEAHPNLKIIFAHFYFLSKSLERAAAFLDAHPKVCFDLAPHLDMYQDFALDPATVSDFFLRYQDRVIYGTDMDTRAMQRSTDGIEYMLSIAWLIRAFLEMDGAFTWPARSTQPQSYFGLGLPPEVLVKIYAKNFERLFVQPTPR
jgi:hypothetical protein